MPEYTHLFPKNKKIGFVGLGISNLPVALMLKERGYYVTLRDKRVTEPVEGFNCIFGENYLKNIYEDILFLAPAVRHDIAEIAEAQKRGVYVTTEINEFFKRKKGKVIAVTGSDGKTTTTTLIYEILKKSGVKTLLGGNIGLNLLVNLEQEDKNTVTVCELSSFQLMKAHYAPDIAVITNIAPNHLDWHTGMDEYINAKKNIYRLMKNGLCVLNADDAVSMNFINEIPVETITVSGTKVLNNGVYFDNEAIYYDKAKIINCSDILLPGRHNRYNYCQAIAAAYGYTTKYIIEKVAKTFPGVKYRGQFIREVDGVKYFNSSIDSSPTRTAAALRAFNQRVIVIAGGYDKKIPLDPLGPLFEEKAKQVILMGNTGTKIKEILEKLPYSGIVTAAASMEEAVTTAYKAAKPGDIVILSPAAASYDMYKNFEERGDRFADCVGGLKEDGKSI
ncbi:MAG: UDP-N-acetylmuramoyl-L-alanine--D-glutamate ligase [Eubacteriales bacterium]|nr:UDP-N-acetylmuramoyl-L-alanine--D-glutamate ligase [Eubacteriales bacterium]